MVLNARRRRCPEEEAPSTEHRAGQQQLYSLQPSVCGVGTVTSL